MRAIFSSAVHIGLFPAVLALLSICSIHASEKSQKPATSESSAATLVKKALESELAGDNGRRDVLLCEAIKQAPDDPAAHWQLGELRGIEKADKAVWVIPSQVELAAQSDPRLAEYRKLREMAGPTLAEQIALAQWCRKNKLENEERVHWLSVLQLHPDHSEAIQRLGLHNHQGTLLTAEQIAQYQEESRKFAKALERWRPLMTAWRKSLERGESSPPSEVRERAVKISEPSEILAFERFVWQESHGNKSKFQSLSLAAAHMLGDNPHPAAADCLAQLAVLSEFDDVREACIAGLKKHSLDHYAPLLLAGLQTLTVSDAQLNLDANRLFANSELVALNALDMANQTDLLAQKPSKEPGKAVFDPMKAMMGGNLPFDPNALIESQYRRNLQNAQIQTAKKEAAICNTVANANPAIAKHNARIVDILNRASGIYVGEEPLAWWKWWWEEFNDTYTINTETEGALSEAANLYVVAPYTSDTSSKPEYRSEIVKKYAIEIPSRFSTPSAHSCFAPGTKVWTQLGKLSIETLKPGDRVLAQRAETGELAYKPVLQVTIRRPGPRIKVGLGSETITATPSHPFWVNGKNWQLTKQLEVGQVLHTVSGGAIVERLEEVETDPSSKGFSYNLIVADFSSYFVGEQGILVHDNSPRRPTSMRIPGLTAETTAVEDRVP